jgi:hypothetical protein
LLWHRQVLVLVSSDAVCPAFKVHSACWCICLMLLAGCVHAHWFLGLCGKLAGSNLWMFLKLLDQGKAAGYHFFCIGEMSVLAPCVSFCLSVKMFSGWWCICHVACWLCLCYFLNLPYHDWSSLKRQRLFLMQ